MIENARVRDLKPGDVVLQDVLGSAVFIADAPHPHYAGLRMVVWLCKTMFDEAPRFSIDALSPDQVVGKTWDDPEWPTRRDRLTAALERQELP